MASDISHASADALVAAPDAALGDSARERFTASESCTGARTAPSPRAFTGADRFSGLGGAAAGCGGTSVASTVSLRNGGAGRSGGLAARGVAEHVVRRGRSGLEMLLEARHFAEDLARDPWDFALEIGTLHRRGLTHSDLRWLVCKNYLAQRSEILPGSGSKRAFRTGGLLTFTETSCFVLTDAGAALLGQLLPTLTGAHPQGQVDGPADADRLDPPGHRRLAPAAGEPADSLRPSWDRDRQELRVGQYVVKRFKLPAPNQQVVLAVFDEEGWPVRIDDPLPPRPKLDSKRRLHDTINSLNRNQKSPLIRFLGDGTGRGICWQVNHAAIACRESAQSDPPNMSP